MVDKVSPNDSRFEYKTTTLNGQTYSYIHSIPPNGQPIKNTIFLIHGFPDIAFGWRYQIPLLASLGLQVIVPDMMGYAGTSAPEPAEFYTLKRASDDIAALASQLNLSSIILGGHDWGGAVVYRVALHYPDLISAVFSICTPFSPPQKQYIYAPDVLPNFRYQKQLGGNEVKENIVGEEKIRDFLNGIYGGRTKSGNRAMSTEVGVIFEELPGVGPSPFHSKEEMDFYVEQFSKTGLHGPTSWYRTSKLNFEDERELSKEFENGYKFKIPFLFVTASKDAALPPAMSKGMDKWFEDLTRAEVDAHHWALWEKPKEVNDVIEKWVREKCLGEDTGSKL